MKILFITGYQYLPQLLGGLQRSTDLLCRHLIKRNHKVAVLAGFKPSGLFALACKAQKKILRRKASRDIVTGYPVWRAWFPWGVTEYVIGQERPDIVIACSGEMVRTALAAKRTSTPIILQMHDVMFDTHGGDLRQLGDIPSLACSRFTAERYHSAYGLDPTVIYPLIDTTKCLTKTARKNITFINTVPQKGLDIALKIARLCPEIPFCFQETAVSSLSERRMLLQKIADLPNVKLLTPQNDMHKVYRECKILLFPSLYEETYGMVATEAQISGIPVIASNRGGLPEAVGPGGILLDPEGPIEDWVNAVRKLWQDDAYYSKLSDAALTYAQRPEINADYQTEVLEKALLAARRQ